MDFRGRSNQSAQTTGTPAAQPASHAGGSSQFPKLGNQQPARLFQLGSVVLLFAVTALVIALTFLLAFGGANQQRAVNKDAYQAVFLNNGQVYFGHIRSFGAKSVDLRSIYYLQTSGSTADTTAAASNVSLVKLGCELHAPFDQMLINSDQVIFWENLQDSGQVVKAITEYQKTNTKQTCSTASQNSTQQAPSTTPATTSPTPSPTTPTTKKP